MTDYRQHNVHAEVVQPEPAKPRSEVRQRTALVALRFLPDERAAVERAADDLGVSLSSLIRTSTLAEIGYEIREPEPAELTDGDGVDPQATDDLRNQAAAIRAAADAALSVVAPLLAAKDDTELWKRDLKAARAEVTFWQGQVTEAHQAEDRLMQEHNTVCALAVNLRDDIVRLVTAALGTWDDEANSDEQIAEAERRIKELHASIRDCHDLQNNIAAVVGVDTDWDAAGRQAVLDAVCRMSGNLADALRVANEGGDTDG